MIGRRQRVTGAAPTSVFFAPASITCLDLDHRGRLDLDVQQRLRPPQRASPVGRQWLRPGAVDAAAGARTLAEFHERAVVGVQSPAGFAEGQPRG